jgi:hypothetical protein
MGGYGCGLNMRIDSAILENSKIAGKSLIGAPIFMCNQYRTPVDIDANNFRACPDISSFCSKDNFKNNPLLKEECWKQCARIQIDKLTDNCWTMAGSGKLNFEDTWLQGITGWISNPYTLGITIATGGAGWYVAGPLLANALVGAELIAAGYFTPGAGEKILRCYRFRIVSPVVSPVNTAKTINYADGINGRSWSYSLNSSNLTDYHLCSPTQDDPMCSFGGIGVSSINELGEVKYKINGNDITVPKDAAQLYQGTPLNYNITDPRNQVCYITYNQANVGPKIGYNDSENKSQEVQISNKYVVRSCTSWNEYSGSAKFIN